MTGDNIEERVEQNLQKVTEICQSFVDRITSPIMIDEMPRQLRAICYFMLSNGELYGLDIDNLVLSLMSGFIMLRFICPAITVPNNYGIMPSMPQGNVRANLTLVARVLQKLANGEKFETEMPHLMPMNTFIEKNHKKLFDYLRLLPKDTEQQEGRLPFGDLQRTITFEDIHFKTFDMKDLVFIHQMIYEYGYELIVSLQNEVIMTHDKRPVSIVSTETDFLSLVQDLGPPPDRSGRIPTIPSETPSKKGGKDDKKSGSVFGKDGKKGAKDDGAKKVGVARKRENLKDKTYAEIEQTLLERSLENLLTKVDAFDLSELEAARFVYMGKPTKANVPVIYFVLHRIRLEFLEHNDRLFLHVYKTIVQALNGPYVVVVDMSWADLDDEVQAFLYRAVVSFTRLMRMDHLTNCQNVFILHPTFKSQIAIDDCLNLIPDEKRIKLVRTAYDWSDLGEVIDLPKIWLPFVSKKFVPMTYNVLKVNNVERKQERLMKMTNESMLNIDPRVGTTQNEIMLQKIEEIRSRQGSNEIIIKYRPETEQEIEERGGGYFIKAPEKQVVQTRKYSCYTEQQRDVIVDAVFEAGVRSSSLHMPQVFAVEKISSKKNKRTERVFKFTLDSILHFKDRVIKREIPYSTIQSFFLDNSNKNIIYINFMYRGVKKQYVLETAKADILRDSLLDSIKRFRFNIDTEIQMFNLKDFDGLMDRFFQAAKPRSTSTAEQIDTKKWKSVMRIDQPCNELERLFKRFKPHPETQRANLTQETLREVCVKLKLELSDDEREHIRNKLDTDKKGFITYDDLIKCWLINHREKSMMEKKRAAEMRRRELLKQQQQRQQQQQQQQRK